MRSLLRFLFAPAGSSRVAPMVRLVAGLTYLGFGVMKFVAHASETRSFDSYRLPHPGTVVYLVGLLETGGGLFLLAGLLVRLVALALVGDMVGAILLSGVGKGELISLTLAPALLVAMLFLLRVGAGPWSLDARWMPWTVRRRSPG